MAALPWRSRDLAVREPDPLRDDRHGEFPRGRWLSEDRLCPGGRPALIWQALADWVCARGPDYRYAEAGTAGPALPVPAAAEISGRRSRLARPHLPGLSGWIAPGVRAWLVFSQFTPIWFIVSQEDIQSQAELDVFVRALAALGRHLGRGLPVAHEWDIRAAGPILRYDPAADAVSRP